jgi:hemerythrin superfamily protein
MDAVDLLTQDHRKVEAIFMQLQQEKGGQSQQLLAQLYRELSLHAMAEENIFYPALASNTAMSGQLIDAFKEHGEMKAILGELAALGNGPSGLSDRVTKLMKKVEHHVKDEEGKVFPAAREMLDKDRMQVLGQQIMEAKQMALPGVQNSLPAMELGMGGSASTTGPQSFA